MIYYQIMHSIFIVSVLKALQNEAYNEWYFMKKKS